MLIEFRVENHCSIREEQALSFEAASALDDRVRQMKGHATGLLPAIGIYGANASGKSNVLSALAFACQAVSLSHRRWAPDGGVPRTPFAWGGAPSSLYELTMLVDGVRYQYGFVVNDARVMEEWLFAWPHGRKQTWLVREGDVFRFGDHLTGDLAIIQRLTRPNALYLSAAAQLSHNQLSQVFNAVGRIELFNVQHPGPHIGLSTMRVMDWIRQSLREAPLIPAVHTFVRVADFGITDVRWESADLEFQHVGGGWLPLEQESHGTKTLVSMATILTTTLERGGVLVVDELEAGLHPALALFILRQFNDPKTNPNNAQLLFSTHDTHLLGTTLGEPPLRRDQVWLTEKDAEGATHLYPLTNYQPRKAENLERGYLQGRYGAIPILGELPPPETK